MSRRLLSSLRLSTRLTHVTARSHRVALARRMMSSETGHGSASSDRTWMIGSALVFGPLFLYLVSPSARKDHHGAADHGHTKNHDAHGDKHDQHAKSPPKEDVVPITDDEGTEVSGQEVKESIEKALEADSPKDAREQEEAVAKETTTEDSVTETHPGTEPATEVVSEPSSISVTPVEDDVTSQATSEDTGKATAPEVAAESKA